MEWLEAKLYTTNEGLDAVCAMLMNAGIDGMEINDDIEMKKFLASDNGQWDYVDDELIAKPESEVYVRFYVTENSIGKDMLHAVESGLNYLRQTDVGIPLGRLELDIRSVNDKDWLDNWKKYFKPIEIGEKVVIRPVWEEYRNDAGKTVFSLDPGHVFGTGLHQTTQLCIEWLEKIVEPGKIILDIGCGTGILSIIGMLLGAEAAVAIDTDPNAADIVRDNLMLNGIDSKAFTILSGNIITDHELRQVVCRRGYDIVVSNIVADVIIALAPIVPDCLKPCGMFISSGIISERIDEVKDALTGNGFNIRYIASKDDWYSIVCAAPGAD